MQLNNFEKLNDNCYISNTDCLESMKYIPNDLVDLVLCDPPYGTIKNLEIAGYKYRGEDATQWDDTIDINLLFSVYVKIVRENGKIILFSQEPYTCQLRSYHKDCIRFLYPMIWKKNHFANGFMAKKAPVSYFEDINVFSKIYDNNFSNELRLYSRKLLDAVGLSKRELIDVIGQKVDHFFRYDSLQFSLLQEETYDKLIELYHIDTFDFYISYKELNNLNEKYKQVFNLSGDEKIKSNVLEYSKDTDRLHPTQKPIALLTDLVKTYTNENNVVLDNCMGSGSTGVACLNTNRIFIGIEKDKKYYEIAKQRLLDTSSRNKSKLF